MMRASFVAFGAAVGVFIAAWAWRRRSLSLRKHNSCLYVGVDIGKTRIRCGLVDSETGKVMERRECLAEAGRGGAHLIDRATKLVTLLLGQHGAVKQGESSPSTSVGPYPHLCAGPKWRALGSGFRAWWSQRQVCGSDRPASLGTSENPLRSISQHIFRNLQRNSLSLNLWWL